MREFKDSDFIYQEKVDMFGDELTITMLTHIPTSTKAEMYGSISNQNVRSALMYSIISELERIRNE